jgi:hypothetical protein
MNIVRRKPLGQFPGEGIASDITLGPQDTGTDTFPMYYDPGLIIAEQGAPPSAPAPAVSVPQPSGSPTYATFGPYGTLDPTAVPATAQIPAPGSISPAPHVTIPMNTVSGFLSSSLAGIPMVAWLGIGLVGILALSSSGGRRRR